MVLGRVLVVLLIEIGNISYFNTVRNADLLSWNVSFAHVVVRQPCSTVRLTYG